MKLFIIIFCCFVHNAFGGLKNLPKHVVNKDGKYISLIDGMELIYIPAGSFIMGSKSGNTDERPEHEVELDHYFIDKYEVSNLQFEKFVKLSNYIPEGPWKRGYKSSLEKNNPVVFITWHDAYQYSKWAKRSLPTEAQWEYAAKGERNYQYPWGTTWNEKNIPLERFVAVDSFKHAKAPFGNHLMAGNAWEWVLDWYDRHYYQTFKDKTAKNPLGPKDGAPPEQRFVDTETAAGNERSTLKVIKGGSGFGALKKENNRGSKRMWGNPRYWFNDTGFRCGFSLETS